MRIVLLIIVAVALSGCCRGWTLSTRQSVTFERHCRCCKDSK